LKDTSKAPVEISCVSIALLMKNRIKQAYIYRKKAFAKHDHWSNI